MACPTNDKLARAATGNLGRWRRRILLHHLGGCESCRERYEALVPALRGTLLLLARSHGHLPPDPVGLRNRIFAAVDADPREAPRKRATARQHSLPRLAPRLAAAVLLIVIVALGVHLLTSVPTIGRLTSQRGAVLFAASGESLSVLDPDGRDLRPGDLVLGTPGCAARLRIEGAGEASLAGSTLVVVGNLETGPALYIDRGAVVVRAEGASPITVQAGSLSISVSGSAEIEVLPSSLPEVMALARSRSNALRPRTGLLLCAEAYAGDAEESSGDQVRVHALEGTVNLGRGFPLLNPGLQVVVGPQLASSPAVKVGGRLGSRLHTGLRLSKEELSTIPVLLERDEDPFTALSSAAESDDLSERERGLAVWVLGELGAPDALPSLRRLLAPSPNRPTCVRSAAVRSLALLGDRESVRDALHDPEDAVAEAAALALPLADPTGAGDALLDLAKDASRPAFLRALAAARAHDLHRTVPVGALVSLARAGDPDAARIADRLLARHGDAEAGKALLEIALTASGERQGRILEWMGKNKVGGAEALARACLASDVADPYLRAAAASYLFRRSPDEVVPHLAGLLSEPAGPVRTAGLRILSRLRDRKEYDLSPHLPLVQSLIRAENTPSEDLVFALKISPPPTSVLSSLMTGHPSPDVRRQAIQAALGPRVEFTDRGALLACTRDPESSLHNAAWQALAKIAPVEAAREIESRIAAGDAPEPEAYLAALREGAGSARDPRVMEEYTAHLEKLIRGAAGDLIRADATACLAPPARRGARPAIALLLALLESGSEAPIVRAAAAGALAWAPEEEGVLAALRDALASEDPGISSSAAAALNSRRRAGKLTPRATEALRAPVGHAYARATLALLPPVDLEAVNALLLEGEPAAAALLLRDLPDEILPGIGDGLRSAARSPDTDLVCLALSRIPGHLQDPGLLSELLSHADPLVRLAAAGALHRARIGIPASELAEILEQAARSPGRSPARLLLEELTRDDEALAPALAVRRNRLGSVRFGEDLRDRALARGANRLRLLAAPPFAAGRSLDRVHRERLAENRQREAGLAALEAREADSRTRAEAVATLSWAAGRADLEVLFRAAGDPAPSVREAVRLALRAMLARTREGLEATGDRAGPEGWWSDRAYAFGVPVLGNMSRSSR